MIASLHHRRAMGLPTASLYPTQGLLGWYDTSIANTLVLNGSGQVTSLVNQVKGGPPLVASAPLTVLDQGSRPPLVSMQAGNLLATAGQLYYAPTTIVQVLQVFDNTPYYDYQVPMELSDPASGNIQRLFIKQSTQTLVWDGDNYTDQPSQWRVNAPTLAYLRSAGESFNYGDVFLIPSNQGGTMGNFFAYKRFSQWQAIGGNYGLLLWLVYNRRLRDEELSAITTTALNRFF